MPDWLHTEELSSISIQTLAFRLVLACVGGYAIAWMARLRTEHRTDPSLPLTLVLMCVLIAMATQIIGSNIARAFSLVGALSIVRFRTAVSSTQDVAFVLAAVVVGMAVGAGQYLVALFGWVILVAATWTMRSFTPPRHPESTSANRPWRLILRATVGQEPSWLAILPEAFERQHLIGVETARRGSAVEYEYEVHLRPDTDSVAIIHRLSSLPQLESVSLKQQS